MIRILISFIGILASCPAFARMSALEYKMVEAINQERIQRGLRPLASSSGCVAEAQFHAADMAKHRQFSHSGSTGSFASRARLFKLMRGGSSENIARGTLGVPGFCRLWLQSPGHRANLLNPIYRSTGVGYARDDHGRGYWVQCFSTLPGD